MLAGRGGLQGARSPFSWLGVACASRHEGSMNVGCVWPPSVELWIELYKSIGSFGIAKEYSSGAYFCDHAEFHRESYAV